MQGLEMAGGIEKEIFLAMAILSYKNQKPEKISTIEHISLLFFNDH